MKAWLIALVIALGFAGAAEARQLRWPETGTPAITVEIPDEWTSKPDTRGVNLLLISPTGNVSFSIYLGKVAAAPDSLSQLAAAVKTSLGPRALSFVRESEGAFLTYASEVYIGVMSDRDLRVTFYRIDAANIGSISTITSQVATTAEKAQGAAVFNSIRVIP
jgi:hypothetical protein